MRKIGLFFLFFAIPIVVIAQTVYDRPAEAPIINTYVPMTREYMILKAATMALEKKQNKENFEKYTNIAYSYLKKNQIAYFVSYAQAALETDYYNSQLYYNLGIAYYLLNEKRKGKKFLKRALKNNFPEAHRALYAIKKKEKLSNSWFIY